MAIYVIFENEIHDRAKSDEYKAAVPEYVSRHGGEYLARDGAIEVPVGDWKPNRIVIFKWPSRAALEAFQAEKVASLASQVAFLVDPGRLVPLVLQ